jgi:hypothetical protein
MSRTVVTKKRSGRKEDAYCVKYLRSVAGHRACRSGLKLHSVGLAHSWYVSKSEISDFQAGNSPEPARKGARNQ